MAASIADAGFRGAVRKPPGEAVSIRRSARVTEGSAGLAASARAWPVAALALVPAFFHPGALVLDQMSSLAFAVFGLLLCLSGTVLLAAAPPSPSAGAATEAIRILGAPLLLSGLLLAAVPGPGIAVLAALVALCRATRHATPPLHPAARLLLTGVAAALAFDIGTIVLGMPRGADLLAWAAAVAIFGELLGDRVDLLLRDDPSLLGRRRSAARREAALGFAALAALALYFLRLPPDTATTGWATVAAYAAFAFFLLALWRGLRAPAVDQPDPLLLGAVAGWALSSGFANGSALPGSALAGW